MSYYVVLYCIEDYPYWKRETYELFDSLNKAKRFVEELQEDNCLSYYEVYEAKPLEL